MIMYSLEEKISDKDGRDRYRDYLFKYLGVKGQGNRSTVYSCTSTVTFFVPFIMGSTVSAKKVPFTPTCYSR